MNNLAESINEHYSEDDNVDGIIDHVTGYKKLIDFTLIEWRSFKLLINCKYVTIESNFINDLNQTVFWLWW